ncbi:MAG: hypothetical protein KC468_11220 [Myxococcales bacterium]|nr:hypothetical protein [Myxococcales bacterium]
MTTTSPSRSRTSPGPSARVEAQAAHVRAPGRRAVAWALAGLLAAACGAEGPGDEPDAPVDDALTQLALTRVSPGALVPGTRLILEGRSFVAPPWAEGTLILRPDAGAELRAPVTFVDFDRLELTVDDALLTGLGAPDGWFSGQAILEFVSAVDGRAYRSAPLELTLRATETLTPQLELLQESGLIFVNDELAVAGDGLLLGGDEGVTVAALEGCVRPAGADACAPVPAVEVALTPELEGQRDRGTFRFAPQIAGIEPGAFEGQLRLRNLHQRGAVTESGAEARVYELLEPMLFGAAPTVAGLGQYVDIQGGGFVDPEDGGQTLISLVGSFTPDDVGAEPVALDLLLVPERAAGTRARYVVAEDDALGQRVDLRRVTGTITGVAAPIVSYQDQEITGAEIPVQLGITHVRQVVYVAFQPSYVESLRHFGLRAADQQIRARALEVLARAYEGVGVELREQPPDDFALYSQIDIAGPDPNGLGLLGYDNSPGKDVGNLRLYDRIGSVNALTQEDGYPGYGGVFVESMFAFSEHPEPFAAPPEEPGVGVATPLFDAIFDPFRPDRGGAPLTAADFDAPLPTLQQDGRECPAGARDVQVACAIRAFGSLVGTTAAHELGHALGLADPDGAGFHNLVDAPGRIMDAGVHRGFAERAELDGEGPARFCVEHYAYLRSILPVTDAPVDPAPSRPACD